MNTIHRISPSAMFKFEDDRDLYFQQYLSDPRLPREPQSKPAAAGSAFDAHVKAHLSAGLLGESLKDTLDKYMTEQVEQHVRDFGWAAGEHLFQSYVDTGAYRQLAHSISEGSDLRMEFKANTVVGGVPISGYPDLVYKDQKGRTIILDWKVNGYCSKSGASPMRGFVHALDDASFVKPSRSNGKSHKDAVLGKTDCGLYTINTAGMQAGNPKWADQLSMYAWMGGADVGSDFLIRIDQLACRPNKNSLSSEPQVRVVLHSGLVSAAYQARLLNRLQMMWGMLSDGCIWPGLTEAQCEAKQYLLTKKVEGSLSDGTPEGDFFAMCATKKGMF